MIVKNICWVFVIYSYIPLCVSYFHELSLKTINAPPSLGNESLFGYGIAYQENTKRLIVGGPQADGEGQVYQCSLENLTCDRVAVEFSKYTRNPIKLETVTYTHNFLLGVSVASGPSLTVTCAPRVTSLYDTKKFSDFGTFGQCFYLSENMTKFERLSSPATKETEYKVTLLEKVIDGYGWSVYISPNDKVLVGSPPMGEGRVLVYDEFEKIPHLLSHNYMGLEQEFMFNFGYSITEGNFLTHNEADRQFAISTTYGKHGAGIVMILSQGPPFQVLYRITDSIIGALFGASLCSADLNGNGIDELLVGSPVYSPERSQDYDTGAVHVYLDIKDLTKTKTLTGSKIGGYFGNTIINIGDLDGDQCEDICVGAPYEDSGRGAVYLYSGATISREKVPTWMQRIQAEGVLGVGLSLSPIQNYDENGCNGLAIGAPMSNAVLFLHCMTEITLTLQPELPNIQLLSINVTDVKLSSCFKVKYPTKLKKVSAKIHIIVRITHKNAKITNPNELNNTVLGYIEVLDITKEKYCTDISVTVPQDGDYSEVLKYEIEAELLDSPIHYKDFDPSRVILSSASLLSVQGTWSAARGASPPNITMNLQWTLPDNYIIGTTDTENVTVTLTSVGDPAATHAACVRLRIHGVGLLQDPPACKRSNKHWTCTPSGPLFKPWYTGVIPLDMKELTSAASSIRVIAELYYYCTGAVNAVENKTSTLTTNSTGVIIKGVTSYNEEYIKVTKADLKNISSVMYLQHIYKLTNEGPTAWEGLQLKFALERQDHLTYSAVKISRGNCAMPTAANESYFEVRCNVPKLLVNDNINIDIPIEIHPSRLDGILNNINITIATFISVECGEKENYKMESLKNHLYFQPDTEIPLWIILVASFIGVVLLSLVGFILYEIGFFGRENKKKLKLLRKSVYRQSKMRHRERTESTVAINSSETCEDLSNEKIE